jgi:hypothetical protein
MIRKSLSVGAILAIGMLVAMPAQAGGTSGTKNGTKVPVRFKNIGAQPVQVNAQSGSTASGGAAVPQNGFYQADVKPGAFTAVAKGLNNLIAKSYQGTANKAPIYLYVEADNTATTITVAPPF